MDDWEAELERDRQRMAAGQDIEDAGNKRNVQDDDMKAYASMMAYNDDSGPNQRETTFAPPAQTDDEAKTVEDFYANYEANLSAQANAPQVDASQLKIIPMQLSLQKMFGSKFGPKLYFCDSVAMYVRGWFSAATENFLLFVTANAIYFGDPKTGELVLGRSFGELTEMLVLGATGVALRCASSHDIYMSVPANRADLVKALPTAAGVSGVNLPVNTRSEDYEKGYRKDIKYVTRKEFVWEPQEDPRTGLPLVSVPEKHVPYYTPLVPKLMHWFGGVNQVMKDWKGTNITERRGCWVTATSIFLSLPSGPQVDGRHITRCIGIEYMGEVFSGAGGALGIVVAGGPKQIPLTLLFDNIETKEKIIKIFEAIFLLRKGTPLKVTRVPTLENTYKIEKASDKKTRPELFVMKTRDDLLQLLRSKSK